MTQSFRRHASVLKAVLRLIRRSLVALMLTGIVGIAATPGFAAAQTGPAATTSDSTAPTSAPSIFSAVPAAAQSQISAAAPADKVDPKFDASLDQIINTLQNDQSRAALLAQLKSLKAAGAPASKADDASDTDDNDSDHGLLGAISSGFDVLEGHFETGSTALQFWGKRLTAAGRDFGMLFTHPREPPLDTLTNFLKVIALWGGVALTLLLIMRQIERRLRLPVPPPPDAPTRKLLVYLLCRVGPWVAAFFFTVHLTVSPTPSLGRMFALVLAYTIVCGAGVGTVCVLLFSLFANGYRRPAVRILVLRGTAILFAIGVFGALGDAMTNVRVAMLLGRGLAATVSTLANLLAAGLTGYFVIRFRRPVAHLLRNRSFSQRRRHRLSSETLQLFASLWYWPMLVLVTMSTAATVLTTHRDSLALRRAIGSAGLLVITFLLLALISRGMALAQTRRAQQRVSPYVERLLRLFYTVVVLTVWLAFAELLARLWGSSLLQLAQDTDTGQRIAESVASIGSTILIAWLLWIIVDTAIREAISPSRPRRHGRVPSLRLLTVLPLVRNALFLMIMAVGIIATLANLGINVTPLIAGAGVIGIAIGLGAQSLVKDLLTGIFIIVEDTLSIGDWVEMDGRSGAVEGLTIRTVRIRDGDGAVHAIPFSEIKAIKNQSREFSYATFNVRVTYDSDIDQALRLIRETTDELLEDYRMRYDVIGALEVFGLDRFDAGAVVLQARLKTRPQKQYGVIRAFNQLLKQKIDANSNTNLSMGEQMLRVVAAAPAVGTTASPPSNTSPPPDSAVPSVEGAPP